VLTGPKEGQGLFGNIVLAIAVAVETDLSHLRVVSHTAITLFGDTVHDFGNYFQIVAFPKNAYFVHGSPQLACSRFCIHHRSNFEKL
jgi:hypothetical protein